MSQETHFFVIRSYLKRLYAIKNAFFRLILIIFLLGDAFSLVASQSLPRELFYPVYDSS